MYTLYVYLVFIIRAVAARMTFPARRNAQRLMARRQQRDAAQAGALLNVSGGCLLRVYRQRHCRLHDAPFISVTRSREPAATPGRAPRASASA